MMSDSNCRVITIDAKAESGFEPDRFRIEIDFNGFRDEKSECVEAYNKDFRNVRDALMEAGIPAEEIKSSAFRVTTRYDWYYERVEGSIYERYKRAEKYPNGYEYYGDCAIEGRMDQELLALVWGLLQELEGGFSYDISYALESPAECERQLLKTVVRDARARAEVLAEAAGAELGEVAEMRHGFMHASSMVSREERVYGATPSGGIDLDCDCLTSPDFNPESIIVSCEVTISWALA